VNVGALIEASGCTVEDLIADPGSFTIVTEPDAIDDAAGLAMCVKPPGLHRHATNQGDERHAEHANWRDGHSQPVRDGRGF
jgi:hypothetical protein